MILLNESIGKVPSLVLFSKWAGSSYPTSLYTSRGQRTTAHQCRHGAPGTPPFRNKGSANLNSNPENVTLNWGFSFYHQPATLTAEDSSPSVWKIRIIRFYRLPSLEYLEINDLISSICFTPMAQSVSRVLRITVSTSFLRLRLSLSSTFFFNCPQWKTS